MAHHATHPAKHPATHSALQARVLLLKRRYKQALEELNQVIVLEP
jgi:hypothetical protein